MNKKKDQKKKAVAPKKATAQKTSAQHSNTWRSEPGVKQPLRVGRGIRTRDEFLFEQKNKNIHSELPSDELYRRGVVLDIDDSENIAIVKTHSLKNNQYPQIPGDSQRRRYETNVQTKVGTYSNPESIRIEKNKIELAPAADDVTEDQVKKMIKHIEKTSPKSKKRLALFRKNKSRN